MEKTNKESIFNFDDDNSSDSENEKNIKINDNFTKSTKIFNNSSFSNISDENTNNNKILDDEEKLEDEKIDEIIIEDQITIFENNQTPHTIEKGLIESIKKRENVTKENLDLAEKINFKNKPDQIIDTDEFGFIKTKCKSETNIMSEMKTSLSKEELLTINARTEKWRYMIDHFDEYKTKKVKKLKERTRKGIPDSLRSYVWQLFGKIDKYIVKGFFEKLEKEEIDPDTELTIIKDLDRTFPSCQLFKDKYGMGQRKLFKVLSSYSKFNKDIGYVQGMGYLVAIFLIYMDEQSSFYLLHSVIKNYELERIYLPGFPDLKKKFYVLLNLEKKFIPKVYDVLKRDGIFPSIYASEWFICLFSKDLKPNVLVRIFDTFLFEGFKVIYRFALAFLKMKEKDFVKSKPGIIFTMDVMKKVFEIIDITELFKVAFSFRLSKKHITKFEQEYENNKDNSNNEFMKQL